MADNPLFINGTQQIRVDAIYAGQNPSQFTIDIAAGGTHTINNYALLYYGVQQPEKQELIINSTFSDSPLLKIGYKKTGKNKVYVYAIDVVQNITVAEFNDTYSDYVIGLGIVHAIDDKTGHDWYALGTKSVNYWDGENFQPMDLGAIEYKQVAGNSLELKNTSSKSRSVDYGNIGFLGYRTNEDMDLTTRIIQVTTENNDFPKPEKSTDTSDLDPKGGGGTETNRSDTVDTPNNTAELNNHSGVEAGFISLYSPSTSQLRSLASYLWTSDFVDNVKKMFGDPMDVIIGLTQMPFTVPTGASS
jgi:hypothetical protein